MTISFPEFPAGQPVDAHFAPSQTARRGLYRCGTKRLFDVTAVVLAAPVIVPLIIGLVVAVALDGGQPFYTQDRVGRAGRTFRMWKLRSMVRDADARLEAHLAADPAARQEWDATQKLKNDPRITRLGRFLRRSSLDELPQLWNVVTGDMSLVGPRPMMVNQTALYPGTAYYALRPGITGLWQIAGRNRTTFAARAEFDTAYEAKVSLRGDMSILWRTVSVVVNATGY
jgi:exopolysaccharide production protein ExoY